MLVKASREGMMFISSDLNISVSESSSETKFMKINSGITLETKLCLLVIRVIRQSEKKRGEAWN